MTDTPPVIDGDATELHKPAESRGVALTRLPTRDVLMPLDTRQVVQGMKAYQNLLHDLLEDSDWQRIDKNGKPLKDPFPKKSAWRKISRAFNLSVERVDSGVERDANNQPLTAWSTYRAIAPNGQVQDGDGYCTRSEFTGYRSNDPKLEHNMRATATTRAKNRAIADLVGMGEVSAEEMTTAGEPVEQGPPYGKPATDDMAAKADRALRYLLNPAEPDAMSDQAQGVWAKIVRDTRAYGSAEGGYMPWIVARALAWAAAELKTMTPPAEEAGAGTVPFPLKKEDS